MLLGQKPINSMIPIYSATILYDSRHVVLYQIGYIYVIRSAKTGLTAHDRKFNFLSQTQRHIKFHCQNEQVFGGSSRVVARVSWVVACQWSAHWQSVLAVWVHHGALVVARVSL